MPGLPTQVPWRRFICVLQKLGYTAQTKHGSQRSFTSPERIPNLVSFREPHPGQDLPHQCCACVFANCSWTRMSSCSCWNTARSHKYELRLR